MKEMEINGETYVLKSSIPDIPQNEGEILEVGESYYIRTVTHHYTGRLLMITDNELLLGQAAWVADSGRWKNALENGKLDEVEPYPDKCIVNRHAVCDYSIWNHELPRVQK